VPLQRGENALVLCYHAVSPTWTAPLSVTPQRFGAQITRLLRRGYKPTTFAAVAQAEADPNLLAVTFDDAFCSVFAWAAPILEQLRVPATVFAPSGYIGTERPMSWDGIDRWIGTEHEPELMPMSWAQLDALASAGWEIGSHTETHPRLTSLDDVTLQHELRGSRLACEERLGRPCVSVAYPYGDVDDRVAAAAASAGYLYGAGLPGLRGQRHRMQWVRVGIYHRDPMWRFGIKVARSTRRLRDSPSVEPLISAWLARRGRRTVAPPPT
jgi:peptidoglycan/xylan/chitin deacetylase (PgdA/CDA1 family)